MIATGVGVSEACLRDLSHTQVITLICENIEAKYEFHTTEPTRDGHIEQQIEQQPNLNEYRTDEFISEGAFPPNKLPTDYLKFFMHPSLYELAMLISSDIITSNHHDCSDKFIKAFKRFGGWKPPNIVSSASDLPTHFKEFCLSQSESLKQDLIELLTFYTQKQDDSISISELSNAAHFHSTMYRKMEQHQKALTSIYKSQLIQLQVQFNIEKEATQRKLVQLEYQLSTTNKLDQFLKETRIINLAPHILQTKRLNNQHPEIYAIDAQAILEKAKTLPTYQIKIYHDGSRYEGEFITNRHGIGSYTYSTGNYYVGEWWQGYRNGIGLYEYVDGNKYCGQWQLDLKHGKGTGWFDDGSVYTGDYKDNSRSGYGVYTYKSGNQYKGCWSEGLRQGLGTYIYENGDCYRGEFLKNLRHGYGESFNTDGTYFKGYWCNGEKHGHGVSSTLNEYYIGAFHMGKKHGQGTVYYVPPQGVDKSYKYQGSWFDNCPHGPGELTKVGGDGYVGMWEHGKMVKGGCEKIGMVKRNLLAYARSNTLRTFCDLKIKTK
ncbi:phosphatidylinositol 4-phosphate 5-kinase [Acrasis kona]|uniref:Phosphatidylinositol 4-phosphate 5-kinase n=1 Tax=Acrasis kona TaxID=1008807 RepID=A0AAW2ZHI6_9EUKA